MHLRLFTPIVSERQKFDGMLGYCAWKPGRKYLKQEKKVIKHYISWPAFKNTFRRELVHKSLLAYD